MQLQREKIVSSVGVEMIVQLQRGRIVYSVGVEMIVNPFRSAPRFSGTHYLESVGDKFCSSEVVLRTRAKPFRATWIACVLSARKSVVLVVEFGVCDRRVLV